MSIQDLQALIEHLNRDHQDDLMKLVRKHSDIAHATEVKIINADLKGVDLVCDEQKLRINFMEACDEEGLKGAILELCQGFGVIAIEQEIQEFEQSLSCVMIASLDEQGHVVSSYAPIIQLNGKKYIYISEVADHFRAISTHSDNIEILFIEDESKAKNILARKRVKYKVRAHEITRQSDEFNAALDSLESSMQGGGGIKTIRLMEDFHLFLLEIVSGRFVKGFGQAYDVLANGDIIRLSKAGFPHKMPSQKS